MRKAPAQQPSLRRHLAALADCRARSPWEAGAIAVCPAFLVQTALPHRDLYATRPDGQPDPTRKETVYAVTNGTRSLTVRAGYTLDPHGTPTSLGIPYGALARLLLVYIATEALRTGRRRVDLGPSLSHLLRTLDIGGSGGRRGRTRYVHDQLRRLTTCVFSVERTRPAAATTHGAHPTKLRGEHLVLAERYRLWWDTESEGDAESRGDAASRGGPATGGTIVLGDGFFRTAQRSSFPVDLRKLQALRASPLAMDLYAFCTYNAARLSLSGRREKAIPWRSLHTQLGSHYHAGPDGLKEFARAARRALDRVRLVWPELDVATPPGRFVLRTHRPDVPMAPRL